MRNLCVLKCISVSLSVDKAQSSVHPGELVSVVMNVTAII